MYVRTYVCTCTCMLLVSGIFYSGTSDKGHFPLITTGITGMDEEDNL